MLAIASSSLFGRRAYSKLVDEHFSRPRNVGQINENDNTVGSAIVGKAACGDVIKLQIKVTGGRIEDVKFKAFGCGSAIASSSYATELIKGMTLDEALKVNNRDISEVLALPPIKVHCSLLAEDAIRFAVENYKVKNNL